MKLLTVFHKNQFYEFRLLESVGVIEISKGGKFTYLMSKRSTFFICSCPGAVYHHKCWHVSMIKDLEKQESVQEPWALWAEEAGRMSYGT